MGFDNSIKTVALLTTLIAILMGIGYIIGSYTGVIIAFLFGMLFNFFSYWYSDKIVLSMYNAKKVSKDSKIYQIVKELATNYNLPTPKVYIVNSANPNAFATGRNPKHSAVAVTTGLLNLLDENEIKGVIGHELSHIKHRDTLIQTITVGIATTISMIANMLQWALIFGISRDNDNGLDELIGSLLIIILAPLIATLIQLAISRNREYLADEGSAKLLHNPDYLISALRKLETGAREYPITNPSLSTTSSLFIVNPFRGRSLFKLFMTHPTTKERIKRLKSLQF